MLQLFPSRFSLGIFPWYPYTSYACFNLACYFLLYLLASCQSFLSRNFLIKLSFLKSKEFCLEFSSAYLFLFFFFLFNILLFPLSFLKVMSNVCFIFFFSFMISEYFLSPFLIFSISHALCNEYCPQLHEQIIAEFYSARIFLSSKSFS